MIKYWIATFGLFAFLFVLSACYKEEPVATEYSGTSFLFKMSENAEEKIDEARGEQFFIEPTPSMHLGSKTFAIDRFKIRGQSALDFQRKSFAVKLSSSLLLPVNEQAYYEFEKFKLISMVFDYTYIENRLAHRLLQKAGLWPLHSFYTEVLINQHHKGLYLFVNDPAEYLFNENKAVALLRRYYQNQLSNIEINEAATSHKPQEFTDAFMQIYELLNKYNGVQLYWQLEQRMNIEDYMRKMAIDFLLKNGDTTDETFFYAMEKNGAIYFNILPWDYDDLFSSQPHEAGRDWAVGTLFGERRYPENQDVLNALDGRLIYSIEDDLDYIIAIDDYLYEKYLEQLKAILPIFDEEVVTSVFDQVYNGLWPFYQNKEIIHQSQFDSDATSTELLQTNIDHKKELLTKRIGFVKKQLSP
jgi:hypothetical protein